MASAAANQGRARPFAEVEEEVEQRAEGRRVGQIVEGGEAEAAGQVEEGGEAVPQLAGRAALAPFQPDHQGVGLGDQVEQDGKAAGTFRSSSRAAWNRPRQPPGSAGPPAGAGGSPGPARLVEGQGAGGVGGEGGQAVVAGGGVGEDLLGELEGRW